MRILIFCHSLLSDWNHGNAHFLRGIASELLARGNTVEVYEPRDAWSVRNLVADHGEAPLLRFHRAYPGLASTRYNSASFDVDGVLEGADLVLVHEWNDPDLVRRIGCHHSRHPGYLLFFHDTHHRAITDPDAMAAFDLSAYDGVLAFGRVLRDIYLESGRVPRAWAWHEAADTRVFRHAGRADKEGDVIWIGNWGDDERAAELSEYLLEPVRELKLRARVHGVRYPSHARAALEAAGIEYCGWIANYEAPRTFARFRATVHVPRRPYVEALRGIPTIRMFEALACGIPLVSAPWDDCEGLFHPGRDYLMAANGAQMKEHLRALTQDESLGREIALHGRQTVLARHTCAHRVDELMGICRELGVATPVAMGSAGD